MICEFLEERGQVVWKREGFREERNKLFGNARVSGRGGTSCLETREFPEGEEMGGEKLEIEIFEVKRLDFIKKSFLKFLEGLQETQISKKSFRGALPLNPETRRRSLVVWGQGKI